MGATQWEEQANRGLERGAAGGGTKCRRVSKENRF